MLRGMNVFVSSMEDMIFSSRHARPCAGHPRLSGLKKAKTWMAGTNPAMTAMLFSYRVLQRPRAKRVARFDRALLVAGQEPLLALRRGAVGKGVRHHPA